MQEQTGPVLGTRRSKRWQQEERAAGRAAQQPGLRGPRPFPTSAQALGRAPAPVSEADGGFQAPSGGSATSQRPTQPAGLGPPAPHPPAAAPPTPPEDASVPVVQRKGSWPVAWSGRSTHTAPTHLNTRLPLPRPIAQGPLSATENLDGATCLHRRCPPPAKPWEREPRRPRLPRFGSDQTHRKCSANTKAEARRVRTRERTGGRMTSQVPGNSRSVYAHHRLLHRPPAPDPSGS